MENREFWKNEMGQALREIQQVYDDKMELMRGELETFYNLKVWIRTEHSSRRYRWHFVTWTIAIPPTDSWPSFKRNYYCLPINRNILATTPV
jgi:hypothetical protein